MSDFEPMPGPEPSAPPARYPFWGYQDLALFAGLAVPSLVLAFGLVQAVVLVSGIRPDGQSRAAAGRPVPGLRLPVPLALRPVEAALRPAVLALAGMGAASARDSWTSVFGGPVLALLVAVLGLALQTPEIEMPIKDLLTDRFSIVLVALFATTLGPLCEELAFRGFLLPLVCPFSRAGGRSADRRAAVRPPARSAVLLVLAARPADHAGRHGFRMDAPRSRSTLAATLMHAGYNLTFFSAYLFQGKDLPDKMVETIQWTAAGRGHDRPDPPAAAKRPYRHLPRLTSEVAEAIRDMIIRGAPAIGVAAAMGVALGVAARGPEPDLDARVGRDLRRRWPRRGPPRSTCSGPSTA